MYLRNDGTKRFKKSGNLYCDYCKLKNHTRVHSANVVGNEAGTSTCFNSTINIGSTPCLIIDTGATNHMVANLSSLDKSTVCKIDKPKTIHLPNGDVSLVKFIDSSVLPNKGVVTGVFQVPQFQFNLLSVSKLTKELHYSTTFFLTFVYFRVSHMGG